MAVSAGRVFFANAARQHLASHCALVGLVARKHVEQNHPRRTDWALGAMLAGFLHDIGKLDPAFQDQLALGEPPDSPFGAGPRVYETSWALTHLAFDPARMRKHLPAALPWPIIQYVVYWRKPTPINAWEQKRFASLSQIRQRAGAWIENYPLDLSEFMVDLEVRTAVPLFEMEPQPRITGEVQTPAFKREADLPAMMSAEERSSQEVMGTAIRSALLFSDRMVSPMGGREVDDWLHAWRTSKLLPELVTKVHEVDDYTTIPGDDFFNQDGVRA